MVDQVRLELTTPALSTQCSNQLSYWSVGSFLGEIMVGVNE